MAYVHTYIHVFVGTNSIHLMVSSFVYLTIKNRFIYRYTVYTYTGKLTKNTDILTRG